MKSDLVAGIIIGFMVVVWLNAAPFSDASKYRESLKECEKSLPRDQQCKVIGVPDVK